MGRIERRAMSLTLAPIMSCAAPRPVIVYLPPSVTVDSSFLARRNVAVVSGSRTFWEAMSSLDTGFVARQPVTEPQRAFARALGSMMLGRQDEAALTLDSIRRTTSDTLVRAASRVLMTAMLQYQDKWKLLAELNPGVSRHGAIADDKADVESWATVFKEVAPRRMEFPSMPVVLPLTLSAAGTPVVPVSVNGKVRFLWLDTGSSMSILASDVAADCGVEPLVSDTLEIATTTGRVPARPTAIARLDIGGIGIANSTAMIVSSDLMQVRLGEGDDPRLSVKIDGVIGFDIMSRLDIRIDYVNRRVTLLAPMRGTPPRVGRNLYWVGTPVVRMLTSKGVPLHFNLDTGAQETYSTDGLIAKTRVKTFAGERRLIGGFAGLRIAHGRFIDELHLTTAGQPLKLRKLLVFAPAYSTFVSLDGVLGSDVGRSGVVRIDATNGLFLLEASPPIKGLRPVS